MDKIDDTSVRKFMSKVGLICLCCALLIPFSWAQEDHGPIGELSELSLSGRKIRAKVGPAKLDFSISVEGLRSYWSVMSFSTLPNESLRIRISDRGPGAGRFRARFKGRPLESLADNYWKFTAPSKHGFYSLKITEEDSNQEMQVNIIVMHPWNGKDSSLNGYKIGYYQSALYKGYKTYAKPRGFIEVTEENQDNWVSPHFQLKQFACRQTKTGSIHPDQNPVNVFPKYMLLETRLLLKLELLIQRLKEKGIRTDGGMYVHSAYRTPYYNRMIGNKTVYSRHCYGDAADIFIDVDQDKMMDDLDRDGKTGDDDADIMFQTAHELLTEPWHEPLVGGVGYYKNQSYRGPFIHVDTRGFEIHWGKSKPKVPSLAGLESLANKLTDNQRVIVESKAFYQEARKLELKADREAKHLMALIDKKNHQSAKPRKTHSVAAMTAIKLPDLGPLPMLASTEQALLAENTNQEAVQTGVTSSPSRSGGGWWSRVKQFFARLF